MNKDSVGKRIVLDFIDYLRYKVERDALTLEEANSIASVLQKEMHLVGTVEDFAQFFGKTKDAINGVIQRRMVEKPRRNVVLYSFNAFYKIKPNLWDTKKL